MVPSYSRSTIETLYEFFEKRYYSIPTYVGGNNTEITFENYNFNPVFLKVSYDKASNLIELPSFIRTSYNNIVQLEGDVAIPLTVIDSSVKRTADSILKYLINKPRRLYSRVQGLNKASTIKNEVYYGASGLILDKDFKPLIIGIAEYSRKGGHTHFKRDVLKVSPSVFISDGLVEKAIIKRLIPYYTTHIIDGNTVRVEIDDITKYIVKPIPPMNNAQETFKQIMSTYKEEIMDYTR